MKISINLGKLKNIVRHHKKMSCFAVALFTIAMAAMIAIRCVRKYTYIYVLMCGLGNQMYMYAFGHIFERETGNKMLYDLTRFNYSDNPHSQKNMLAHFNIDLQIATDKDIKKVLTDHTIAINQKYFALKTIYLGGKEYTKRPKNITIMKNKHPNGNYKKIFRKAKFNNLILQTMPMNVEYLNKYRQELLEKFTLREKLDAKNQAMLDKIKSHKNSVSIHIRRGDYLKYNRYNILDVNYYQEAMAKFAGMEDLHFFVFSNDIPWVKKNIKFSAAHTFVDINDELNGYKDMWLMKHCKHNIIANSTFSWWGAWLNENPDKIVVKPLCWSTGSCNKRKTQDPEDWEIIDNSKYVKRVNEQLAKQNDNK